MNKQQKKIVDQLNKVVQSYKKKDILIAMQIQTPEGLYAIGSMSTVQVLGALKFHQCIIENSIKTGGNFDQLVQQMEKRPELVVRLANALQSAHDVCDQQVLQQEKKKRKAKKDTKESQLQ